MQKDVAEEPTPLSVWTGYLLGRAVQQRRGHFDA